MERRLPGLGSGDGLLRNAATLSLQRLCRADAPLPARGRRAHPSTAARGDAGAAAPGDGPAAQLVSALRGCGGRGLPAPRADPAPDAHVSLLGVAERLAPADHRAQRPLCADPGLARTGLCRGRLGARDLALGPDRGARGPYGRAEREHRLELERHRQAAWRLGARPRRARRHQGVPAEPPDFRAFAGTGRRDALVELRSGHGPGGVVRPAREDREGGAAGRVAAAVRRPGRAAGRRRARRGATQCRDRKASLATRGEGGA